MNRPTSIISWNVNGLRAVVRKGNWDWILKESPDIVCLQETKCTFDQLPLAVSRPEGYHTYFSWPTVKKGYSGVAIYSKTEPEKIEYGIGMPGYDDEGRVIVAYYGSFILLNVYFPNGGGGPERLKYKLEFYDHFLAFIEKLKKKHPAKKVIFCGDVNTAHEEIDLARPKENEKHTGFLPEERAWLDEVVAHGYVDVFRHFYPSRAGAYTYWDMKTFARERNIGWRIDYFFASQNSLASINEISILNEVHGSDHCPLKMSIKE